MNRRKIEEFVDHIHKKLNVSSFPVDLEGIAESLGIRVKYAPSDDFSGLLLRKDGKALIGINSMESTVRQRFTIAHEFGHYFMHESKDAFVDYRDNKPGAVRDKKEIEANMFAAAFLMPRKELVKSVKSLSKSSGGIYEGELVELASMYGVSRDAMNYRLLNLGILN